MELWHVTNGYCYPVEATRDSYFVGPRGWDTSFEKPFGWAAVFVKGKALAEFVASAVNVAIMEGFRIDHDFTCLTPRHWKIYRPFPCELPESNWLCRRDQPDPTEDDDFDFDMTHPIRIHHGGRELAEFVLFAINYAVSMGHVPECGGFR